METMDFLNDGFFLTMDYFLKFHIHLIDNYTSGYIHFQYNLWAIHNNCGLLISCIEK